MEKSLQFVREMPTLFYTKATILAHMGEMDGAKAIIAYIRAEFPEFKLAGINTVMFKRAEDRERFLSGLRATGVPD